MDKATSRSPTFPSLGIGSGSLANADGEDAFREVIASAWRVA